LECYNIIVEEDEDLHNINITKSGGNRDFVGLEPKIPDVAKPIKFTMIGDH